MSLYVERVDLYTIPMQTRMPFRYGISTLLSLPHLILSAGLNVDGRKCTGLAADCLPPKWFTKHPDTSPEEDIEGLWRVIHAASGHALAADPAPTPFALWQEVYSLQKEWGEKNGLEPLLWQFGVTLIERAVIDGFCRAKEITFNRGVHNNLLGIDPGAIYPELDGASPKEFLPNAPQPEIGVRHTVGLSDPIFIRDADDETIGDGLPVSLESSISEYDLRYFKIKISGDMAEDFPRLTRISRCLPEGFSFSLDGNECFTDPRELKGYYLELASAIPEFFNHMLFLEQPLNRYCSFTDATRGVLSSWKDKPLIIIDESDGEVDSLKQALSCGYDGTSYKSCKGVMKGVVNACYLRYLSANNPGRSLLLSGEDLGNVGPVALLQDCIVALVIGISHAERNGHHYFAGASMLPEEIQKALVEKHGDLYAWHQRGFATMAIRNGSIRIASLLMAPFGYQVDVPLGDFIHDYSAKR